MRFTDHQIIDAVQAALPDVTAVYLYGSHAAGMAGPESDLDLAITCRRSPSAMELGAASTDIASRLGVDAVDLVDLRRASTVLKQEIVVHGRRLFGSGVDTDLYELFVLREAEDFDIHVAPIVADILSRGSVYGR